MAQSLFKFLHQSISELTLDVVAPLSVYPLLKRMPEINKSIAFDSRHGRLNLFSRIRLGLRLKQYHYDEAIIIPRSLKAAIPAIFAGIKKRSGFRRHFGLINNVVEYRKDRQQLFIRRYLSLASERAYYMPVTEIPRISLREDAGNVKNLLRKYHLEARSFIAVSPGAEYGPSKQWKAERYAQLARKLVHAGYTVCILGSDKDRSIARYIKSMCSNGICDLTGLTTLTDVIDLLSVAGAMVSNDSGLMHIAAATQTPLLVIYGSTSARYTPPLPEHGSAVALFEPKIDCSPCFERSCRFGHYRCLDETGVESVFEKLMAIAR